MFITFEGIDGSGKTTQSKACAAALRDQGYDVLLTREPGGTALGDEIRQLLLDQSRDLQIHPRAELLLFCASRAQLVSQVIMPHLERGGIVLCDRYADSTLAYQGYGHGLPLEALRHILNFATGGLQPNLTIYLDLDPAIGLQRRQKARLLSSDDWNRLDDMALAFHRRVYAGYQALMADDPQRWQRISAEQDATAVQNAVMTLLTTKLPQKEASHGQNPI